MSLHACFLPVSNISHSVASDMQTIEQETPTIAKPKKKYVDDVEDSYFSSSSRYSVSFGFWISICKFHNKMYSGFESWGEGSLNLCTHPACFQGISESEELWKSWLCLRDRWICEGVEVALLGKWSELCVCRFYLVQSLVSACTDSCHINLYLLYSQSSDFCFVRMTCVHSFLLSFLCYYLQIKKALKSDIRCTTVASFSACQIQKLQSFWDVLGVFLFQRFLCIWTWNRNEKLLKHLLLEDKCNAHYKILLSGEEK